MSIVNETRYNIHTTVETQYLVNESDPNSNQFAFTYTITITNNGSESAQLLSRHWVITDGNDATEEVHGQGVVGKQPHIPPGNSFRYTSGAVLKTNFGTMHGSYQMLSTDGHIFDAEISPFALASPNSVH